MRHEWSGMKLGLDRFRQLLALLGHPERRFPAVLVGGTNGKGSAAAALSSMFAAAGYRTGLYTSPHLLSWRERVRVNGRAIRRREASGVIAKLGPAIEANGASFFEAMTALAFLHFAREKVDLAVLEVGIGGLLDATNAVDEPVASIVVSVGLDHREILGPRIAAIARDKAGIARRSRPFVIGAGGRARLVLLAEAKRRGARPLLAGVDGRIRIEEIGAQSSTFSFATDDMRGDHLELGLAGKHQVHNAACALLALTALAPDFPHAISGVRRGLARLRWPGRLERVESWLLLDGAHNPAGARVLADHVRRFDNDRRVIVLAGMVAGKQPRAFARALTTVAVGAVTTEPTSERAVPASRLAAEFERAGLRAEAAEPDPARALARARASAGPRGLVVVCGSLYLLGSVMRLLRRRPPEVL